MASGAIHLDKNRSGENPLKWKLIGVRSWCGQALGPFRLPRTPDSYPVS